MITSKLLYIGLSLLLTMSLLKSDTYIFSSNSSVLVEGTSTIHDWTMKMEKVDGKATFEMDEEGNLGATNVLLTLKTENLKSKHTQMDNIAYKAMKTKDFPNITFTATSIKSTSKAENVQTLTGNGKLTIAGVTKSISLKATCKIGENGAITCKGAKTIKMTDFNIDPPTAMLGTIKTGDEITIVFNTGFSQIDQ